MERSTYDSGVMVRIKKQPVLIRVFRFRDGIGLFYQAQPARESNPLAGWYRKKSLAVAEAKRFIKEA